MNFFTLFALLAASSSSVSASAAYKYQKTPETDVYAKQALATFKAYYFDGHNANSTCNASNVKVRKEWSTLTAEEKRTYLAANKCMVQLPPKSNVPGARTRLDDLVATHANQALDITNTGSFLAWHRFFVLAWEQVLRDECGFKGTMPYLDWVKISHDLVHAPMFDGSELSFGSNGARTNQTYNIGLNPVGTLKLPAAGAGGCIDLGPFAGTGMKANIGPKDSLVYNPRCIKRDLLNVVSRPSMTDKIIATLIGTSDNITAFQNSIQAVGNTSDFSAWGAHPAGHSMIGGNVETDFWASAADPYFFLHHAGIDRTWWIWQNMEPENRTMQIAGNRTAFYAPPNGTVELTDEMLIQWVVPNRTIETVMSTARDDLCYLYV